MKKLFFSAILLATNFAFGQITLEHSFPDTETVYAYTKGNEMFYVSETQDNKLKIYNADYSLRKTVNVPIPSGYILSFTAYSDYDGNPFAISKHIFNTDDKYEFMVEIYNSENNWSKLLLIDEDGTLIKDFHPNQETKKYGERYNVYNDSSANINKLIVYNWINNNYTNQADVYSLPTSELTSKEIQSHGKLSAFPVPTDKIINITNPDNGANVVEIYDASGKLVINKGFLKNETRISVNVENLPKGVYTYKIGNQTAKFIKN